MQQKVEALKCHVCMIYIFRTYLVSIHILLDNRKSTILLQQNKVVNKNGLIRTQQKFCTLLGVSKYIAVSKMSENWLNTCQLT